RAGAGGRRPAILRGLRSDRQPQHDDGGRAVCVLLAGGRAHREPDRRARCGKNHVRRNRGVRVLDVHGLRLRAEAGALRPAAAAVRRARLRVAAPRAHFGYTSTDTRAWPLTLALPSYTVPVTS